MRVKQNGLLPNIGELGKRGRGKGQCRKLNGPGLLVAIDCVECRLQLVALRFKSFIVCFGGDEDLRCDFHVSARKGKGNLEAVPASFSFPKAFGSNREGQDWHSGFLREQYRAHLGDVTWTFWSIDRKR